MKTISRNLSVPALTQEIGPNCVIERNLWQFYVKGQKLAPGSHPNLPKSPSSAKYPIAKVKPKAGMNRDTHLENYPSATQLEKVLLEGATLENRDASSDGIQPPIDKKSTVPSVDL